MLPGLFDLNLYRGDSGRISFVLWQDAEKTLPLNLASATASAQIRDRPDSTVVLAELTCAVTLPNIIAVSFSPGTAATLKAKGAWDLQLNWSNGDIQTVVAGAVYAEPDVTRA